MRSIRDDDVTAAARIREAAIVRFGRQGFARTSVREIARDAGVSPGLVLHHFGSKDGLRRACDEWLVAELVHEKSVADVSDIATTMRTWLEDPERFAGVLDYFAMMLVDGTPDGNRLFDRLVEETAGILAAGERDGSVRRSSDPGMRAIMVTLNGLAPILLRSHLARAIGDRVTSATGLRRMTVPTLELYTHGLYADSRILDAYVPFTSRTKGSA